MTGSAPVPRRRGDPLVAMGALIAGWIVLRAASLTFVNPGLSSDAETPSDKAVTREPLSAALVRPSPEASVAPVLVEIPVAVAQMRTRSLFLNSHERREMMAGRGFDLPRQAIAIPQVRSAQSPPSALGGKIPDVQPPIFPARRSWTGDAWIVWRAREAARLPGPITQVYGASQAGGVLRYELAVASTLRPLAYLRAVHALETPEGDVAAGIAIRPLTGLSMIIHGEARLTRRDAVVSLRPAAFLSAGVDEARLAAGFVARGYAQAGYVGGREATGFADGSLVAESAIWRGRDATVAGGAGAWGGAQRGAARLDLGPTASLRFRLGEGTARLSADYRLRVAGNAEPAAGAAVTLSAGF